MQVEFVSPDLPLEADEAVAVPVFEGAPLPQAAAALDRDSDGAISRAMSAASFVGAKGRILDVLAPHNVGAARVVLIGVGPEGALTERIAEAFAAEAFQALKTSGARTLRLALPDAPAEVASAAALGVRLASYRFDRYRTREPAAKKPTLSGIRVAAPQPKACLAADVRNAAIAESVAFARDLVSEPPNVVYPESFAAQAKALESLGLKVEILGEADMRALGMGALLGVGQGSRRESQLVVLEWRGAEDPAAAPVAFVGKGVCFDSGGLSLKPAEGMEDMKWDMAGAAAVCGAMRALAARKARVNAVGVLGLVENMPDGAAQRPGDVVTSLSGQTIEVNNTDAEGRLVLADAIWYCEERHKPRAIIDLATLTGSIIISLGHDYAGLFSNDDTLADQLIAAGAATGEQLWRLPLPASYEKMLDSLVADMKNSAGRPGGSITAALFIQRFVRGTPWAHLDIAATAWRKPSGSPTAPDGATGFGVRLLEQLVAENFEA